jgi:hypothetical protein
VYIDSIHIRHLKLLEDFRLSFTKANGEPRLWTVIIGKNGTAKTSILQAIALAAAGQLQVNTLARPVVSHLRDRRLTDAETHIDALFRFALEDRCALNHPVLGDRLKPNERLRSEVTLKARSSTLTGKARYVDDANEPLEPKGDDDPLVDARAQNRGDWFVAGYGVSRFLPDPAKQPALDIPSIERLEPLFSHTSGLTSLRFADHFPNARARQFVELLRDILTHVRELVPDLEDVELRGAGGVTKAGQLLDNDRFQLRLGDLPRKLPAVALSHGYQSTIAWIADLIGQIMLDQDSEVKASEMRGLVLIDEIDLYLHPSWQAGLIRALRETFPRLQFVTTTHSPVVLSALEPDEVVRVAQHPETGSVRQWGHDPDSGEFVEVVTPDQRIAEPDPRTMTGTELYRHWFGVDRLLLNPVGRALREWNRIANDPYRTDEEHATLDRLRKELRAAGTEPPAPVVPREET